MSHVRNAAYYYYYCTVESEYSIIYIYSIQPPDERKRCRPRERTCTGERGNVGKQKQHARKTLTWADFMSVIFTSTEPRPLISLFMQSFDLRLKEVITYHRPGPWQRCFFAEPRCFWPHTCSCPCPPAGPFWWRDYGQPWWKNWGRSLGRSHPRFAATPPEKIFQWSKIDCISTETVSPLPRSSTTRYRWEFDMRTAARYSTSFLMQSNIPQEEQMQLGMLLIQWCNHIIYAQNWFKYFSLSFCGGMQFLFCCCCITL